MSNLVYTCVTTGYEARLPNVQDEDGEFVCFTNDPKLVAPGWELRPLDSPSGLSPHFAARYHKVFAHRLFPDRVGSIWMDGNVRLLAGWQGMWEEMLSAGAGLAAFSHWAGRSLVEERAACIQHKKFDRRDMRRAEVQLADYAAAGFDVNSPITENQIIVRHHGSPNLHRAMSAWWSHLCEYTKRDQMCLQFIIWQEGIKTVLLDVDRGMPKCYIVGNHRLGLIKGTLVRIRRVASRLRHGPPSQ